MLMCMDHDTVLLLAGAACAVLAILFGRLMLYIALNR